jgi:predicted metal-dependent phosphoesterase TrpH
MWDALPPATRFDLHLHSTRSDGRYDPDEVLARCARGGLDVVALTDHDLPTAVAPGPRTVDGRAIRVLAGAEVSGSHDGREHHLLVYFAGDVPDGFAAFCRAQCVARADRYAEAVARLGLAGVEPPGPSACHGDIALTRHHLARALVARGHVGHLREAFARYLGDAHGNVPRLELPFVDAIRTARGYGGLTSWAHPPVGQLSAYLPAFVEAGLQGIEGLRPLISAEDRRKYRVAAAKHGLYLTGGSDWHGWGDDGEVGLFRVEGREIGPFLTALAAA